MGSPRLFVDMDTPGITVRPIETMHGVPEFCEVFYDDVLVPHDRAAGRGRPRLVDRHGPAALRAQHRALAPRRLPAAAARAAGGAPRPPARWTRRRVGEVTELRAGRFRARSRAHAATAGGRRDAWGRRPRSTRCSSPRPNRRVFDLVAEGLGAGGGTRRRPGERAAGAPSSSTRGRRRSTAAAPRSSATSSPAGCSTSETTGDGRRRGRLELFEGARPAAPPSRSTRRRARRRARRPRAGRTRWRSTRAPRSRCSSRLRGGQRDVVRARPAARSTALGVAEATTGRRRACRRSVESARAGTSGRVTAAPSAGWARRPVPTASVVVVVGARRRGRCAFVLPTLLGAASGRAGSIPHSASSRSRASSTLAWRRRRRADVDWDGRRPRAARPEPRARRGRPGDAGAGAPARARADPVRAPDQRRSRPSVTDWPRVWWRSRPRPALLDAAWDEPDPATAPWPRAWPDDRPARWPATPSRCSPASASPTEHPFHHYFRRIVVLDQLLGAGSALTRRLGARGARPASLRESACSALNRRPTGPSAERPSSIMLLPVFDNSVSARRETPERQGWAMARSGRPRSAGCSSTAS